VGRIYEDPTSVASTRRYVDQEGKPNEQKIGWLTFLAAFLIAFLFSIDRQRDPTKKGTSSRAPVHHRRAGASLCPSVAAKSQ